MPGSFAALSRSRARLIQHPQEGFKGVLLVRSGFFCHLSAGVESNDREKPWTDKNIS
jgi:hypothetical protein